MREIPNWLRGEVIVIQTVNVGKETRWARKALLNKRLCEKMPGYKMTRCGTLLLCIKAFWWPRCSEICDMDLSLLHNGHQGAAVGRPAPWAEGGLDLPRQRQPGNPNSSWLLRPRFVPLFLRNIRALPRRVSVSGSRICWTHRELIHPIWG